MQNVVLIIHLLLAISLIGLVLLQRSEGGGLGMGGGGAGGGAMSGRAAASAFDQADLGSGDCLYLHLSSSDYSSGAKIFWQLSCRSIDASLGAKHTGRC